ncbi:MAG: hypothetical protein ACOY35_10090 [Bacillota bacterium]
MFKRIIIIILIIAVVIGGVVFAYRESAQGNASSGNTASSGLQPAKGNASQLAGLDALGGRFPISLRFRDERYDSGNQRSPQAEVAEAFATEVDGSLQKVLREAGRHGSALHQELARALPDKLFLVHFMFTHVSKEFARDFDGPWPFSPAHFAYLPGSRTNPPAVGAAKAVVDNGKRFRKGDAVLLLPVRDNVKLWASAEWAAVTGVNGNTLALKRGVYGSKPLDPKKVPCDYVWVAPNALPYSEDSKTVHFVWNWSTLGPRDEKGRQASDAFAEALRMLFAPGGRLNSFHGLAWDVPRTSFPDRPDDRIIDADVDGVGDNGVRGGVNTYLGGAFELHRKVRAVLGDNRLFLSDGYYGDDEDPRLQLPGVFNGIEHDINTDHTLLEVSSLVNVFGFYQRYVTRPQLNLLVRKDKNVGNTGPVSEAELRQNQCMKNALATILGIAYDDLSFAAAEEGKAFSAADETRFGKEGRLHWLGQPVGPIIRPLLAAPDALGGAGEKVTDAFLGRWESADADLRRDDGRLIITARGMDDPIAAGSESLTFTLPDVPVTKDRGLLVQFEVQAEKLDGFPADVPRLLTVTPRGLDGWPERKKQPHILRGWAATHDYTPVSFYFREPGEDGRIALEFAVQGRGEVFIRNFTIREGAEVFAREFEGGVVLCNPNERTPYAFDLNKLFPDASLRRISGSHYDRHMTGENTGEAVGGTVTLKPQSGLFLVNEY